MGDILVLVSTTIIVFIVQQGCIALWDKIKPNKKTDRKKR